MFSFELNSSSTIDRFSRLNSRLKSKSFQADYWHGMGFCAGGRRGERGSLPGSGPLRPGSGPALFQPCGTISGSTNAGHIAPSAQRLRDGRCDGLLLLVRCSIQTRRCSDCDPLPRGRGCNRVPALALGTHRPRSSHRGEGSGLSRFPQFRLSPHVRNRQRIPII